MANLKSIYNKAYNNTVKKLISKKNTNTVKDKVYKYIDSVGKPKLIRTGIGMGIAGTGMYIGGNAIKDLKREVELNDANIAINKKLIDEFNKKSGKNITHIDFSKNKEDLVKQIDESSAFGSKLGKFLYKRKIDKFKKAPYAAHSLPGDRIAAFDMRVNPEIVSHELGHIQNFDRIGKLKGNLRYRLMPGGKLIEEWQASYKDPNLNLTEKQRENLKTAYKSYIGQTLIGLGSVTSRL